MLVPFRGNRFNILFYNSEVVLYLADDFKELREIKQIIKQIAESSFL